MILDPILDYFRGKAVTIPPLDGAFRPNTALDDAGVLTGLSEADNLVVSHGRVLASSGNAVFILSAGVDPVALETFPAPVTALAVSPSGELAVGLETGVLTIGDKPVTLPPEIRCITALTFAADGTLWLANGSAQHSPSAWAADLMEKGASGSVWKRSPGGDGFSRFADGLAFPYGLHADGKGIVVSESWRHRLLRFGETGGRQTLIDHLPGYPARIAAASDGGAWLTLFAPRNRLIEFVLQETHYRQDMIASVPRDSWIAPALSSGRSFLEPLQCGAIRIMGVHKPWSPSRSYGLLVRLDAGLSPVTSLHSRANGSRHGICSALEHDGQVLIASRGGDCVLAVDAASVERI